MNLKRFITNVILIPIIFLLIVTIVSIPLTMDFERKRCDMLNEAYKQMGKVDRDLEVLEAYKKASNKSPEEVVKKLLEIRQNPKQKKQCKPMSAFSRVYSAFSDPFFLIQIILGSVILAFLFEAVDYWQKNKKGILE